MKFSLLQWNVLFSENVAAVGKFIAGLEPDIVCLQELTTGYHGEGFDSGEVIQQALGGHGYWDYGPLVLSDGNQTQMGVGIFSRFPLDGIKRVLQTGEVRDGKVIRDERIYLEAEVAVPGGKVR